MDLDSYTTSFDNTNDIYCADLLQPSRTSIVNEMRVADVKTKRKGPFISSPFDGNNKMSLPMTYQGPVPHSIGTWTENEILPVPHETTDRKNSSDEIGRKSASKYSSDNESFSSSSEKDRSLSSKVNSDWKKSDFSGGKETMTTQQGKVSYPLESKDVIGRDYGSKK